MRNILPFASTRCAARLLSSIGTSQTPWSIPRGFLLGSGYKFPQGRCTLFQSRFGRRLATAARGYCMLDGQHEARNIARREPVGLKLVDHGQDVCGRYELAVERRRRGRFRFHERHFNQFVSHLRKTEFVFFFNIVVNADDIHKL